VTYKRQGNGKEAWTFNYSFLLLLKEILEAFGWRQREQREILRSFIKNYGK